MSENAAVKAEKAPKAAAGSSDRPEDAASADAGQEQGGQEKEGPGERQPAWAARRDLIDLTPGSLGSLISGDQYGLSGGHVAGDVVFQFGARGSGPSHLASSGFLRDHDVAQLTAVFQGCPSFEDALARLRDEHVVVLMGSRASGRRAAAVALLHQSGASPIRLLDPGTAPGAVTDVLEGSPGFLLRDLTTSRSRPLLEPHLLAMRDALRRDGARLVITVEASAALKNIPCVQWEPPAARDILSAHVQRMVGRDAWAQLKRLPVVEEFLSRPHQPGETAKFAGQLAAHHRGELSAERLTELTRSALADRITQWLTEPEKENGEELRDKAFLVSLAVFDGAPYAVAAELGDALFVLLQKTANPHESPRIPIFGSSLSSRLELAQASGCVRDEVTEWGPVPQYMAEFQDDQTARLLLREVWTVHPSARVALVRWLQQLAVDGRPMVRTRAAAATAYLAEADLPSAMALLIEPWASGKSYTGWLSAANALSLARLLDVTAVSRILHAWCTGEHPSRRWTAIRTYGLLGPLNPLEALRALLDAVRLENEEEEEVNQLAEATQLLLLAAREPVLRELASLLHDDRAIHDHVMRAFALSCREYAEGTGRPLVLEWFFEAYSCPDSDADALLTGMWRAWLADRAHTDSALETLRDWIRAGEHDPRVELPLATLLGALATTRVNQLRLSHLLRTAHEKDGGPLDVADRLRPVVAEHT
ncbi:hypothetical protein ACFYM2_18240 [Streptomyces sp. NPDC006711]|uniref:hypothetical protein n=1 Tax=Streptomyces sp. NPDC006711 TaxID=3364762 RepID=UPI0036C41F75